MTQQQHAYPIAPADITAAIMNAVIGPGGGVYVMLPALDLPGDPPVLLFDIEAQPLAVFDAIWSHHVPVLRNGGYQLTKKATHAAPSRIQ